MKKLCLVLLALLLWGGAVHAANVWQIFLGSNTILDSICTHDSLHGLPDGTSCDFLWDHNNNGRDTLGVFQDSLALTCRDAPTCAGNHQGHDTLTVNSWALNGDSTDGYPRGTFYLDYTIAAKGPSSSSTYLPNPNKFYVRVCTDSMYWESEIISPAAQATAQTFTLSNWRCLNIAPPAWEAPARPPVNFRASDSTYCDGVHLRWDPYPAYGDSIFLYRADTLITRVRATDTSYVDTSVPAGVNKLYKAIARRSNKKLSGAAFDYGYRASPPPAMTQVVASDNLADSISICWHFTSSSGIDSFAIFKNGVDIHRVAPIGTSGTPCWGYRTTDGTPANFCVASWNHVCGYSSVADTAAACDTGRAITPPSTPQNVNATDSLCTGITITWSPSTGNPTAYRVWRESVSGTNPIYLNTVYVPDTHYVYSPSSTCASFRFYVAAYNAAGSSPDSLYEVGYRLLPPQGNASNVQASDSLFCDRVDITWDPATVVSSCPITHYCIQRNSAVIDSVAFGTNSYSDYTAVPDTIYTYKIVCRNTCGRASFASSDDSGSRAAGSSLPAPQNFTATDGTVCGRVVLTWTDLTSENSYYIRRNGNVLDSVAADVTMYHDLTATSNVHYEYTVQGRELCGFGPVSAPDSGWRFNAPPAKVTGVIASDGLCNLTTITWNDVTAETGYIVKRAYSNGTNTVVLDTVPANVTIYEDSAGTPYFVYRYWVVAINACGNAPAATYNYGYRIVPPDQPTDVAASDGIFCTHVALSWTDVPDEDGYYIWRDGAVIDSVDMDVTAYDDYAATPLVFHHYQVQGFVWDCGGGVLSLPDSGIRWQEPDQVQNVMASDSNCAGIFVQWADVAREDSFVLLRNGTALATIAENVTTVLDTTVVPAVNYAYAVIAYNKCGGSTISQADSGMRWPLPAFDTAQAQGNNCTHVTLTWTCTPFTDSVRIRRNGIYVATVPRTITFMVDSLSGGIYHYVLTAVNACGTVLSDTLTAQIYAIPSVPQQLAATDDSCHTIFLSWNASSGDVTSYRICRDSILKDSVAPPLTHYADTAVIGGLIYTYQVSAVNAICGESARSNSLLAAITPYDPPALPQVVVTVIGKSAHLWWNPIHATAQGCPLVINGYLVYYSPHADSTFYYHGFTTDTTYVHTRVVQFAHGMYYEVSAYAGPLDKVLAVPPGMLRSDVERRLRDR